MNFLECLHLKSAKALCLETRNDGKNVLPALGLGTFPHSGRCVGRWTCGVG